MNNERRKYIRFQAKDHAFAALRNGFNKIGKIFDISINGLGFSFLDERTQVNSTDDHTQVNIFISGNGFHLSNIPCRIVYETPDTKPDKDLSLQRSRCGLQFGKLTGSQMDQLEFFLKHYTKEGQ